MSKCLNCKTPLKQLPGKRKKQFCNSTCRSNYWQKQARKKTIAATKPKAKKDAGKSFEGIIPALNKKKVVQDFKKPTTLKELKGMCPADLTGLDRSAWIATNRKKNNV